MTLEIGIINFFMFGIYTFIFLILLAIRKNQEIILTSTLVNYFLFGGLVSILGCNAMFLLFGIWPYYNRNNFRISIAISIICSYAAYEIYLYRYNRKILEKSPVLERCFTELLAIEEDVNCVTFFIIKKEVTKLLINKEIVVKLMEEFGLDRRGLNYLLIKKTFDNMLLNSKVSLFICRKDLKRIVCHAVDELEKLGYYSQEMAEKEKNSIGEIIATVEQEQLNKWFKRSS